MVEAVEGGYNIGVPDIWISSTNYLLKPCFSEVHSFQATSCQQVEL